MSLGMASFLLDMLSGIPKKGLEKTRKRKRKKRPNQNRQWKSRPSLGWI
jgi:hypothetical protein